MKLSKELRKLLITFVVFWIFMGTCAIFYNVYEGWSAQDSFFFAVVTMTSVGRYVCFIKIGLLLTYIIINTDQF